MILARDYLKNLYFMYIAIFSINIIMKSAFNILIKTFSFCFN